MIEAGEVIERPGSDDGPGADGVRWLDDAEMAAWRAFVESETELFAALDADLRPTGLTLGDYQVLVYLSEADGRAMRMCDLAAALQLSPSGLTRRLDGLVRAGCVARVASEADRRVMLAVLTPDGERRLERAAPVHVASVRARIFDHLDADDVAAMAKVFGSIRAALAAAGDGAGPAATGATP